MNERAAVPAFEFAMLFVLGIGGSVEEQFEAGDAADIFGWGAGGAVGIARYSTAGSASAIAPIVTVRASHRRSRSGGLLAESRSPGSQEMLPYGNLLLNIPQSGELHACDHSGHGYRLLGSCDLSDSRLGIARLVVSIAIS